MRKVYVLFIFNATLQYATAQPTVTILPKIGDVITTEYLHTKGVIPGATGANLTWDYSHALDSATSGAVKIVSSAGTPYAADFPGSQYSEVVGDTLFNYSENVNGNPASLGIESSFEKIVFAHPEISFHNPFTYPNSFYDSVTLFQEKPLTGSFKLLDTTLVTGYGTLKLPGITYNNVLQAREISASSGSETIPGLGVITVPRSIDTSYAYYVNGQPGPVLNYSISKGNISSINYLKSATLPLNFISFSATLIHGGVQLDWQTGDESNTNVFHIQRSTDGSAFTNIGELAASSIGSHNYNFLDAEPPATQMLYYRLEETDLDGKSIYSNIVVCKLADFPEITLYPNPAISNITITGVDNFSSLKIYNQAGQQLKYFTIKGESVTVTLTSMPTGVYIAELGNGSKTTTIIFLKK